VAFRKRIGPAIALALAVLVLANPSVHAAAFVLTYGSSGQTVRVLQQALSGAGFDPGPVDGIFGVRTKRAVEAFQKAKHLAVDGMAGPFTLSALGLSDLSSRSERKPLAGKKIMIDPGHGGYNPGALGVDGSRESDNVLAIALRLRDLLVRAGAEVFMTRTTNVEPSLWERTEAANKAHADLFISVHDNAYPENPAVSGIMTFSRRSDPYSKQVSETIMDELSRITGFTDKGVEEAGFYVLRNTNMPAVLCEIGFMTNWADAKVLQTSSMRDKAAQGVYSGVLKIFAGS
jgi:N-acetylmuramoyl-L-alanine amidase